MRIRITLVLLVMFATFGCQTEKITVAPSGKIFFFVGEVLVNGKPAELNQILNSRDRITTGAESRAEVLLRPGNGIQVRDHSEIEILFAEGGWQVHAHEGAVLSLVQRGNSYTLRGPSAVAAVRGTIFYANTYEDSSQYICTCNGKLDINQGIDTKTVSAPHHEGYTLSAGGVKETPMKEHTDLEIFDFMYRLDQALLDE